MSAADDREQTPLEALCALLARRGDFTATFTDDPLVERILTRSPGCRSPIARPSRRHRARRHLVPHRGADRGHDRDHRASNPQASLYIHVLGAQAEAPDEPLRPHVEVIRFGMEQFVAMVPFFFQEGVHAQ